VKVAKRILILGIGGTRRARASGSIESCDTFSAPTRYFLSTDVEGPAAAGVRSNLNLAVQADPRPAFPSDVTTNIAGTEAVVSAIEGLEEGLVLEIVKRMPSGCFMDGAQDAIINGLLTRRGQLRGWLGLARG
jgi:hypothetical protein